MARQKSTHIDNPAATGRRIREAREQAGLRQRDLSFPGCTTAYVSRIEAGERVPSLQVLEEFGRRLGVSAEYLARGGAPSTERLELADAALAFRLGERADAKAAYERLANAVDGGVRKEAQLALGEIALLDGRTGEAIELLEVYDELPPRQLRDPSATEVLAHAYVTQGAREKAIELLERRLADFANDPLATFRLTVFYANALTDVGEFDKAGSVVDAALKSLGVTPDPIAVARLLWTQSRLQTAQGSHDLAAKYAHQALAIIEGTEHVEYAARAHQLVAFIELERGNSDLALEQLDQAEGFIGLSSDRTAIALYRVERARTLAELGRYDEARPIAEELIQELDLLSPVDSARALAVLARVFAAGGETERALGLYEAAANTLADLEHAPMLVSLYADWSDLLAESGQTEAALDVARRGMRARLGSRART